MDFPHSVTIDGETYIHKVRYEREMIKKDAEATNLCDLLRYTREQGERFRTERNDALDEQDRLKGLLDEAQALLADGGVSHAAHEAALAAKDAEIAALQQRLHDAIETRERVIRRLGEQLAIAHNEVERLSSGSWKVEADEKIATLRGDRDLVWSALNVLGWEAVEARDGEIALLSKDGRCVHALLRETGALSPPPPGPPAPPPPSEPPLRIHGVSVGSRKR